MKCFTFLKRLKRPKNKMLLYHRAANKTAMLRRLIRAVRGQIMPARGNQYACHDLSEYKKKINKRPKFAFAQSKRFFQSIIYLTGKKIHWNKQHLAWGKSRVLSTDPSFLHWRDKNDSRPLVGHRKHPFPWAATPKHPSAPIFKKQIPILARANPGDQHPSFYSESFKNLFITLRNIANDLLKTLLDSLMTAFIEI